MAEWNWEQFNPVFASRLQAMVAAAAAEGRTITLTSGRRSIEEQIALRRQNGCPDIWQSPASSCRVPTAIPGQSRHNSGFAADIGGDREWANANAGRFGLHFNVQGEDWHVEMVGDDEAMSEAQFSGAPIGFEFEWMGQKGKPEDELASRLFSMAGIINSGTIKAETPDDLVSQPEQFGQDVHTIPSEEQWNRQFTAAMGGGEGFGGDFGGEGVPPPGYIPPGEGVERWRPVAIAALQYAGEDPRWADAMLRRMSQESGGNPMAVNNWDSNAARGDPSIGLMQNIGSAWEERAQELAGRGIYDGFANMVASIRYTKQRYGDLGRGWNRSGGY